MSNLIDGKAVAAKIRAEIKTQCEEIYVRDGKRPKLAIVFAGNNPASQIYVSSKEKACAEAGMDSIVLRLPEDVTQEDLQKAVKDLCDDTSVNGVMVQLPLPDGIDSKPILESIPFEKDVDGLSAISAGRAFHDEKCLVPCTPKGIICLLKECNVPLAGKHAVIVGRSNLVGKPLSVLLLKENCTVTVCHSKTENLQSFTLSADILVSAVGKPCFIKKDMVKQGATVIDVGINRTEHGLVGDVDDSVKEIAGLITPVPGGVGPMTVTMLMLNTVEAYDYQRHNLL